jgi:RNA polymerase sigma factor (sigma-70 family)
MAKICAVGNNTIKHAEDTMFNKLKELDQGFADELAGYCYRQQINHFKKATSRKPEEENPPEVVAGFYRQYAETAKIYGSAIASSMGMKGYFDDIVHNSLLSVAKFKKPEGEFKTYLYSVMYNNFLNSRKNMSRFCSIDEPFLCEAVPAKSIEHLSPGDYVLQHISDPSLRPDAQEQPGSFFQDEMPELISKLPEQTGAIIRLYFGLDGHEMREKIIAEKLGLPVAFVQANIKEALAMLLKMGNGTP